MRRRQYVKYCPSCKTNKSLESYSINRSRKDGLQNTCKDCRCKYLKEWYKENTSLHKNRVKNTKEKVKEFVRDIKSKSICTDCKRKFHYCQMDFDHLTDKRFNLAHAASAGIEKVKIEISKCELVCANCHRLRTFNRTK